MDDSLLLCVHCSDFYDWNKCDIDGAEIKYAVHGEGVKFGTQRDQFTHPPPHLSDVFPLR